MPRAIVGVLVTATAQCVLVSAVGLSLSDPVIYHAKAIQRCMNESGDANLAACMAHRALKIQRSSPSSRVCAAKVDKALRCASKRLWQPLISPKSLDTSLAAEPDTDNSLGMSVRSVQSRRPACKDDDAGMKAGSQGKVPNCTMAARFCKHSKIGPMVTKNCPETCGRCGLAPPPNPCNVDGLASWDLKLSNRSSFIALMQACAPKPMTGRAVHCALETVVEVCGDCLYNMLHISPDPINEYQPWCAPESLARSEKCHKAKRQRCSPQMFETLAAEQAAEFRAAIKVAAPIGLVPTEFLGGFRPKDLYMHSQEEFNGELVYRGADTGYYLFQCNSSDTWAISSVYNRSAWAECHGGLHLDLRTYQHTLAASSQELASERTAVGVAVYTKWPAKCLAELPKITVVHSRQMHFRNDTDAQFMACWLARYFGPQSARATVILTLGNSKNWTAWSLDSSPLRALLTSNALLSSSADCGLASSQSDVEGKIMLITHPNCTAEQAYATGVKFGASCVVVVVTSLHAPAAASMTIPVLAVDVPTMSELARSLQDSTLKLTAQPLMDKTDVYLPRAVIVMDTDVVVAKGTALNLVGANTTLLVGPWALYVPRTGVLEMAGLTLKASTESPAVWVEGILSAKSCVFTDCTAGLTSFHVELHYAFSGPAVLKLFEPPPKTGFSKIRLEMCTLTQNSVQAAGFLSLGSVALMGGRDDTLELEHCTVSHNAVNGTGQQLMGAIRTREKSSFVMSQSAMIGNIITGGTSSATGAALSLGKESTASVTRSSFERNSVFSDSHIVAGAAIATTDGSILNLRQTLLTANHVTSTKGYAFGGAIALGSGSYSTIEACTLTNNAVHSMLQMAHGGAIRMGNDAKLGLHGSFFSGNNVTGGGSDVFGGALCVDSGSRSNIINCSFDSNRASSVRSSCDSDALEVAGGAVSARSSSLSVIDSHFIRNLAEAGAAKTRGGAVHLKGLSQLDMTGTRLELNRAISRSGLEVGKVLTALDPKGLQKVVSFVLQGGALDDGGSDVRLKDCLFRRNTAGGNSAIHAQLTNRNRALKSTAFVPAAHMYIQGTLKMASSRMSDDEQPGDEPFLCKQICADQWIAIDGGQAVFESCSFSGSSPPQKSTKPPQYQTSPFTNTLIDCLPVTAQMQTEILFRGCTISNLTLESTQALGILNTTITPPQKIVPAFTNATDWNKTAVVKQGKVKVDGVRRTVKWISEFADGSKRILDVGDEVGGKVLLTNGSAFENPDSQWSGYPGYLDFCFEKFAGVPMCDPRAKCLASTYNIGVQCHCAGQPNKALRSADAVDDGHQCTEGSRGKMSLASWRLDLVVKKPGQSDQIEVTLSGTGEHALRMKLSANLTRRKCGLMRLEECEEADRLPERQMVKWPQLSGCSSVSWFGQSFCWEDRAPPEVFMLDLDRKNLKFQDSDSSRFRVSVDCRRQNSTAPCAEDGDVMYWDIGLDSVGNPIQNTAVTVRVEALPSCELTKVIVTPGTRVIDHKSSGVSVQLHMFDVDKQPINFSSPHLSIHTEKHVIKSLIGANRLLNAGRYELMVRLEDAWSSKADKRISCVLFQDTFEVNCAKGFVRSTPKGTCVPNEKSNNLQLVAGALVGVLLALLILLMVYYARKDPGRARKIENLDDCVQSMILFLDQMVTSFLQNEDFLGDALVFHSVVVKNTDKVDMGSGLIVVWVVCFALTVVTSMLCFYLKTRVVLALRRRRRDEFSAIQT